MHRNSCGGSGGRMVCFGLYLARVSQAAREKHLAALAPPPPLSSLVLLHLFVRADSDTILSARLVTTALNVFTTYCQTITCLFATDIIKSLIITIKSVIFN